MICDDASSHTVHGHTCTGMCRTQCKDTHALECVAHKARTHMHWNASHTMQGHTCTGMRAVFAYAVILTKHRHQRPRRMYVVKRESVCVCVCVLTKHRHQLPPARRTLTHTHTHTHIHTTILRTSALVVLFTTYIRTLYYMARVHRRSLPYC
jgi:hypothetical protein